ncbi:hypothetical protein ACFY30_02555 [Streptomyces sp. NPDC000345]|uniref:hypothetical protein n=1 Tax=Streptomyces sp. NPDC000345 TaxID=3364537 RepID=UPI00369FF4B3
MADKQDRWLDRETAERLLRGESPDDAVAPEARDQAELLARTLSALSATVAGPLAAEELPGEAAALKAFGEARAAREAREAGGALARAGMTADAGLVRIGGRTREHPSGRWSRPLRFGLAAALAAGMVGGVAMAAGTGVLPSPFDGAEPAPGASVSAAASPDRLPPPPSPGVSGGTDAATPDGGSSATGRDSGGDPKGGDGSTAAPDATGTWPKGVTSSCRDVRDGRTLDARRRQTLEGLAGGSSRVWRYCAGVLDGTSRTGEGDDDRDSWYDAGGPAHEDGHGSGASGRNGGSAGTGHQAASGGTGSDDDTRSGGRSHTGGTRGNSDDDRNNGNSATGKNHHH